MPRYSSVGCTVWVRTAGSSERVAEVCVVGDIDHDSVPMLVEVTDFLADLPAERIVMDLQHLGFAGSALPNWFSRIQYRLGDRMPVVVRHPQPMVRGVLAATEMVHLIDGGHPPEVADDRCV